MGGGIRVGVDVGGTFTKAVALTLQPLTLRAHAVVPTSHTAAAGVTEGVAAALRALLDDLEATATASSSSRTRRRRR